MLIFYYNPFFFNSGLDPARPLVDRYGSDMFRLTKDDANFVQVIHTNAGLLGETPAIGHVDFCVNGGTMQPSCQRESQVISKFIVHYIFIEYIRRTSFFRLRK